MGPAYRAGLGWWQRGILADAARQPIPFEALPEPLLPLRISVVAFARSREAAALPLPVSVLFGEAELVGAGRLRWR